MENTIFIKHNEESELVELLKENRSNKDSFCVHTSDSEDDLIFTEDLLYNMIISDSFSHDFSPKETASKQQIMGLGSYTRVGKKSSLLGCECSICLEKLILNEGVRKLSCKHTFHKKCIDKWFRHYSLTCPVCRNKLF